MEFLFFSRRLLLRNSVHDPSSSEAELPSYPNISAKYFVHHCELAELPCSARVRTGENGFVHDHFAHSHRNVQRCEVHQIEYNIEWKFLLKLKLQFSLEMVPEDMKFPMTLCLFANKAILCWKILNELILFIWQTKYTKRELRESSGYLDGGLHHFRLLDSCRVHCASKVSNHDHQAF